MKPQKNYYRGKIFTTSLPNSFDTISVISHFLTHVALIGTSRKKQGYQIHVCNEHKAKSTKFNCISGHIKHEGNGPPSKMVIVECFDLET